MSLGTAGYVCTRQIHVGRSDVTDKRPGCYVFGSRNVEFWPSLERNFSGFGCTLEAKTTVSNST